MDKERVLQHLRVKGYRLTPLRQDLVHHFTRTTHPISVPELQRTFAGSHKTTLYRALDSLVKEGLIQEIDFGDGTKRYETASRDHHHHLICTNCRQITDVSLPNDLIQSEQLIEHQHHFQISRHNLEFFGLCINCQ